VDIRTNVGPTAPPPFIHLTWTDSELRKLYAQRDDEYADHIADIELYGRHRHRSVTGIAMGSSSSGSGSIAMNGTVTGTGIGSVVAAASSSWDQTRPAFASISTSTIGLTQRSRRPSLVIPDYIGVSSPVVLVSPSHAHAPSLATSIAPSLLSSTSSSSSGTTAAIPTTTTTITSYMVGASHSNRRNGIPRQLGMVRRFSIPNSGTVAAATAHHSSSGLSVSFSSSSHHYVSSPHPIGSPHGYHSGYPTPHGSSSRYHSNAHHSNINSSNHHNGLSRSTSVFAQSPLQARSPSLPSSPNGSGLRTPSGGSLVTRRLTPTPSISRLLSPPSSSHFQKVSATNGNSNSNGNGNGNDSGGVTAPSPNGTSGAIVITSGGLKATTSARNLFAAALARRQSPPPVIRTASLTMTPPPLPALPIYTTIV
jgi:hypothetical protein